jgi:hypothetical protein
MVPVFTLKMEVAYSAERLLKNYHTARRQIPQDSNHHGDHMNLKYRMIRTRFENLETCEQLHQAECT